MCQVGCKPSSLIPRSTLIFSINCDMPFHHLYVVVFLSERLCIDLLNIFCLCYYQEVAEISSVVHFIIISSNKNTVFFFFFRKPAYGLFSLWGICDHRHSSLFQNFNFNLQHDGIFGTRGSEKESQLQLYKLYQIILFSPGNDYQILHS